ncbi:hypothetical protein [Devosia sp.]|jgi:uncharacterized membrane protein (DUF2068 family)|uniref:hypothetical protein n=1 Tax=Devosia sp. TaxID=1871048 RepID=UPI001ACD5870|nr:hypothetical protein [Devosia sp.]MBN9334394.1 hypothetical protein [Devosia sp.]
MSFKSPQLGLYIRIVALLSLLLGLSDAGRLLGVNLGATSPVAVLGPTGFVLLAIFSLSRLFAGVGLWLKASWGAVLLVSSTAAELALYLSGSQDIHMSAVGFAVRIVLLVAISAIFALSFRFTRAQATD